MTEITAAAVKSLRERTGAGMMDCKRALQEAGADEERAIDILRKSGAERAKIEENRGCRGRPPCLPLLGLRQEFES